MSSRFFAGLMAALVLLSHNTAVAQEAAASPDTENVEALEQGAALLALLTSRLNGLMETVGYEGSPTMSALTAEMFAASIPYTSAPDFVGIADVALGFGVQPPEAATNSPERSFQFVTGTPSSLSEEEEQFATAEGYALYNDATDCRSAAGAGKVADFRRFTSGSTQGHLCVVVTQNDTTCVWQVQARGVAVAGERRVRSYYAIRVGVEGDADKARLLGEPRLDAIIGIGSTLAKYSMAVAELDRQDLSAADATAAWQKFEESLQREMEDRAQ